MNDDDLLIGQQLGNVLIQQLLGRGGMARVYKGIDVMLKRAVAVKLIDEGFSASATAAQRFEHEGQAVASLKHPNIVTVFAFGQQANRYYLVMEYIDGADLDAIMRNYENNGELMPFADVIRILETVAAALDYAHTRGVVHRDVKPSNIMLERDGRPVLTDFGLALSVSEGTVGTAFGSPHYISPEQALSSANAVPQSDLYSLGVVAYELLAGVVPFDDPSPTALAMQHLMAAVPSPRAFNRNLSVGVEQVLFKILAKTPQERYQTAAEFVAALRESLDALKREPVKVASNKLPPLPPGVTPTPPRRLSMQTALDKLNQELALTQARGQSPTRIPTINRVSDGAQNKRGWLPYLITVGGALLGLVVVGLVLSNLFRSPAAAIPTNAVTVTAAIFSNATTNVPVVILPTITIPATVTLTSVAPSPTLSSMPRTASPTVSPTIPPSLTPLPTAQPPTATPILSNSPSPLPDIVPTMQPATLTTVVPNAAATVPYPDGALLVLTWSDKAFFVANKSISTIASGNLAFERLLTDGKVGERYEGARWSQFYMFSDPNRCLALYNQRQYQDYPRTLCPYGLNSQVSSQSNEVFWTATDNSVEFRVLWKKQEIARCPLVGLRCEIRVPTK